MNIFELLVIQPIFNLLLGLYSIVPGSDFGISLIIFTIIVRLAMWPLLKKQLHQTRMMKKLQPELAKIKKSSKGNKQMQSMQMMELYKEHGVSPFRSIGILLIQLPIFIAIFQVVRILTQHRDQIADYTYGFMQVFDPIKQIIASPENFNEHLFGFIDLTKHAIGTDGFFPILVFLAVIAAVMQYFLSKQTMPQPDQQKRLRDILKDASEGKESDQSEMNAIVMGKMIKVLPFFMFFIMVSLPSALTLYYAVSNIIAFLQQRHILKQDEDELTKIANTPAKKPAAKKASTNKSKKSTTKPKTPVKPAPASKPATGDTVIRIKAKDK